jgi:hypothetical protein
MDAILAKRNLAKEKDTAQLAIDEKIQRMAVSARESEFSIPVMSIAGDINLSKLAPLNIQTILTKEPGHITEVNGIPTSVRHFKFERQLLVDAPQLPTSLETLNLNGNYIETIDLSRLNKLKIAKLNGNLLKKLSAKNLPESLEELYVENNKLTSLNLQSLSRLRILHCRNNRMLRIENIPASIVDLQVEEGNPQIVLDYAFLPKSAASEDGFRSKGTETEFVESMHDYFALKAKYEKREIYARYDVRFKEVSRGMGDKVARKMARELRPKCVNCKRPVGTVFKTKDKRLLAYCGDTKEPCALRIEIFKGVFENDDVYSSDTAKILQDTKEKIIRQKMDVLFNYASEEETVAKFKELIEDYNLYSFSYKQDLDMREDKRFNAHKKELIKSKIKLIANIKSAMNTHMEEYASSGNRDSLHTAMDIYIREYMPETNNLRMLKYGVMEMVVPGTDPDTPFRILNQQPVSIRQLESLQGEVPKVLKFVTGINDANTDLEPNEEEEEGPNEEEEEDAEWINKLNEQP